jgi:hypothetical protein
MKPDKSPRGDSMETATEKEIEHLFGQHVIAFTWWEGLRTEAGRFKQKPSLGVASGIVMELYGDWWLATAGHVKIDHDKRKQKYGYTTFEPLLWDFFGPNSESRFAIPFDFFDDDLMRFEMHSPEMGLDYSLILIPHLIGEALKKTIKPFRKVDWLNQCDVDYDKFFVAGLPHELGDQIEYVEPDGISVKTGLSLAVLNVEQIKEPDENISRATLPQFVGRLNESTIVKDIVGMSGGPIIGFRKMPDGQTRYFPVALQSSWDPRTRIIKGTYIELFGRGTEAILDRMAQDFHSRTDADESES